MKVLPICVSLLVACAAAPASAPPAPKPPPASQPFGAYHLVFEAKTGEWNVQVVIAPWGDVVAIGVDMHAAGAPTTKAHLFARDSGAELLSLDVCSADSVDAAAFIDEHRLLIACDDELQEVSFPEGRTRTVLKFPFKMGATAIGGGRIVAASHNANENKKAVVVYAIDRAKLDAGGVREIDRFDAAGEVSAVAVTRDGSAAGVATRTPAIAVRHIGGITLDVIPDAGREQSWVQFSPDGSRLFALTGSFTAGEVDAATGDSLDAPSYEISSWITAVRHVPGGLLATGAHGLGFFAGDKVIHWPGIETGVGLDASPDGTSFCAGGRDGELACFSTKPVAPSVFRQRPR